MTMIPGQHSGVPMSPSVQGGGVRATFRRFATKIAKWLGSPWAFVASLGFVAAWAATGPHFHYSDTWQLVINTVTSVVTFLMVFLIQNTQNRESTAIHLKLDELIRAHDGARNRLVQLEQLSDEELEKLENEFTRLRERAVLRHSSGDSRSPL